MVYMPPYQLRREGIPTVVYMPPYQLRKEGIPTVVYMPPCQLRREATTRRVLSLRTMGERLQRGAFYP